MKVDEIIPWGRTFDEYQRIFALSDTDLAGRILGCGDGPASFNAEATAAGYAVTSCDPICAFSAAEIGRRVTDCYETVLSQVKAARDGFVWTEFRDPDHLGQCRLTAMKGFLADFDRGRGEGRYVTAALPSLPFVDDQFDLALVSHLLFLYSDHLDADFHLAAVAELLRVAKEVRVFPLLTLSRQRSPYLDAVRDACDAKGLVVEVCRVPYEFQRGGNEMLRIARAAVGGV
ncbi:SAM-dependent methyltransferase [Fimbriiglobus ruber]|uniref:SAM-dependent methyltransferase n=1 Tax=Fimbriiglobus ruber TaxID=1908690 RepID=A0A225DG16_9BACT|nr:SAM-dependent methyltransferase [Fimbriiglobus ruber]OWK36296.1 hypothetical protein FRUB_08859 [Fimbriiglobus ruber]